MENEPVFFDFAVYAEMTKYQEGVPATDAFLELCHAGEGNYALDIGGIDLLLPPGAVVCVKRSFSGKGGCDA